MATIVEIEFAITRLDIGDVDEMISVFLPIPSFKTYQEAEEHIRSNNVLSDKMYQIQKVYHKRTLSSTVVTPTKDPLL